MPSSYTAAQKASISQFTSFTSVKDSVAAKHLKAQGWNVEQAVDAPKGMDDNTGRAFAGVANQAETMEEADEALDKVSTGRQEQTKMTEEASKGTIGSSMSMNIESETEKVGEEETSSASLSMEQQAKILERCRRESGRKSIPWGKLHMEEQALRLGAFDKLDETTNPEKTSRALVQEAIADPRPFHWPEKYASEDYDTRMRRVYNEWMGSLQKLFYELRVPRASNQSWIKPENLPLYYRFALRRPLMPEYQVQLMLEHLGFGQDFDFELDLAKNSRNFGRHLRPELLGIHRDTTQDRKHVSTRLKSMKPRGHQLAEWVEYISDVPEEKHDFERINELQERTLPEQDVLSDTKAEGPQTRSESKVDTSKDDEIISGLANYIVLYRSGQYEINEVVTMIKEYLGIPAKRYLILDVLQDLDKTPIEAAKVMWQDTWDGSSSSSSCGDEAADQGSVTLDEVIPSIEDSVGLHDSLKGNRVLGQLGHALKQESDAAVEPEDNAKIDIPETSRTTSRSLQVSPIISVLESEATGAGGTTGLGASGDSNKVQAVELPDPKSISPKPRDPQQIRSPLTPKTNQSPHPRLPERQSSGTPKSISRSSTQDNSLGDPVIFQETTWDGRVVHEGRQRSPEVGRTDDLHGLSMSSKKARGLGAGLGLSTEWLKGCVRTGSIQRKARKINIANNAAILPKVGRRRSIASSMMSYPIFNDNESVMNESTDPQECNHNSKRKASSAMYPETALKSPRIAHHSDVFAREGETSENFVHSHYEPEVSVQSMGVCPQCHSFRCACEDDPVCFQCRQLPCSCEGSRRPLMDTTSYNPSAGHSTEAHNGMPAQRPGSRPPTESNVWVPFLSRALDDDDVLSSLRKMGKDPLSNDTYRSMQTILEHCHRVSRTREIGRAKSQDDLEVFSILDHIVLSSEKVNFYNNCLVDEPIIAPSIQAEDSSAKSVASIISDEANVLLPYLSRVLNIDDVPALLKQYQQEPLSDSTFNGVRTILDHIHRADLTGEIGFTNGEKDLEASGTIRSILSSSEKLKAYQNRLQAGSKTVSSNQADYGPAKSKSTDRVPLLLFLSSILGRDDVLHYLRLLVKQSAKFMSHETFTIVYAIRDQWTQGLEADMIGAHGRIDDVEAEVMLEALSLKADKVGRGHQIQDDHRESGISEPAMTVSQEAAGQSSPGKNPMVAYFSRILPRKGLVRILKDLETESMSNNKMHHVQAILKAKEEGLAAGKFGQIPRPKDRKDAEALAIMARLQASCGPMNAWKDTSPVKSSEPRQTNAYSGGTSGSIASEPENTLKGLGINVSSHSPALDSTLTGDSSQASNGSQMSPSFSDVPLRPAGKSQGVASQSGSSTGVTPLLLQCDFAESPSGGQSGQGTPATSFGSPNFTPKLSRHESPTPIAATNLEGMDRSQTPITHTHESSRSPPSHGQGPMELAVRSDSSGPGPVDSIERPLLPQPQVKLFLRPPKSENRDTSAPDARSTLGSSRFPETKTPDIYPSPISGVTKPPEPGAFFQTEAGEKSAAPPGTKSKFRELLGLLCQNTLHFEKPPTSPPSLHSDSSDWYELDTPASMKSDTRNLFGPPIDPTPGYDVPKSRFSPEVDFTRSTNPSPSPTPELRDSLEPRLSPKVETKEMSSSTTSSLSKLSDKFEPKFPPEIRPKQSSSALPSQRSTFTDLPAWPPLPRPGHTDSSEPPPSPRPEHMDLPKPPPSPRPGHKDLSLPPPSPRPGHKDLSLPSPSPRPGHRDLPEPPPSPRPGHRDLPKPPPSPRSGHKDLPSPGRKVSFKPPPSPRPTSMEWDRPESVIRGTPRVGATKSPQKFSEAERYPPIPRDLPQPAHEEWAKMSFEDAREYAEKDAAKQRKSFLLYMQERRDVKTRMKEEKDRANAKWYGNRFFQTSNGSSGATSSNAISKLFDKYRDNPREEPDKIGVEGSMRYLGDLGVKLDEVVVLAVLTELGAPTMGEFSREGFINGWTNLRAETLPKQQQQVTAFRRTLVMTPDFFKKVYKKTFLLARLPGQKVLPLEAATEYWRLLLTSPSMSWNTTSTPWLYWWIDYLEANWKKSISKDMWDQTGAFIFKSLEDESMGWWSEDSAWPGVLDEFVVYVREKRDAAGSAMEVE